MQPAPWAGGQHHAVQQAQLGQAAQQQQQGPSPLDLEDSLESLLDSAPGQLLARKAGGPTTGPGLLVHTGELVDRLQARCSGTGHSDAGGVAALVEELHDQVCSTLSQHVTGMCIRRRAGAPDLLLRFAATREAQLALGELKRAGSITVPLGGGDATVQVSGALMHLRSRHAKVVVRHLPLEYLVEGVGRVLLQWAGYDARRCELAAEFLGDPAKPGRPGNLDAVVLIVRPPPGDRELRNLPRSFTLGLDTHVAVTVYTGDQQARAPATHPPPSPPRPTLVPTAPAAPAPASSPWGHTVAPPPPPPPTDPVPCPPPPLNRSSPPQPLQRPSPRTAAPGGAAAVLPPPPCPQPAAAGLGAVARVTAAHRPEPMQVDGPAPCPAPAAQPVWDDPLGEACAQWLEDHAEDAPLQRRRAAVQAVAASAPDLWQRYAQGREVPRQLQRLLAKAVRPTAAPPAAQPAAGSAGAGGAAAARRNPRRATRDAPCTPYYLQQAAGPSTQQQLGVGATPRTPTAVHPAPQRPPAHGAPTRPPAGQSRAARAGRRAGGRRP